MLHHTFASPAPAKQRGPGKSRRFIPDQPTGVGAIVQPKLRISSPGDRHEKEADRVAERVVDGNSSVYGGAIGRVTGGSNVQRVCTDCEEELQRKPKDRTAATPTVGAGIPSLGSGSPLPAGLRNFYETRMGADFSQVRVHTDSRAQQSADKINARAYTYGNHIAFNKDQLQTHTSNGKKLLAHELTHVVQQNGGQGAQIQRSCFDGNCDECADGWKTLWFTVFFARRANAATMATLRRRINVAKRILQQCCIRAKFAFDWTLIPNAATVLAGPLRSAGDANGLFNVSEPTETIGESALIAGARGIPMLVVDEVTNSGGGETILAGQDDQGRNFDLEYTGRSMFVMAVNQPAPGLCSQRDSTIAHELWHVTGALRHDAAEAGGIADCSSDDVNQTYCTAVRRLA
jgi:hypothetical protein